MQILDFSLNSDIIPPREHKSTGYDSTKRIYARQSCTWYKEKGRLRTKSETGKCFSAVGKCLAEARGLGLPDVTCREVLRQRGGDLVNGGHDGFIHPPILPL
jgi:hypothetical protein